jgi:iron complex outermembrane recepter protein
MTRFRLHPVALATLALAALPTSLLAQTAPAPAPAAEEPQRVIVTGSLIKRLNSETPSSVQLITREDIRTSGAASVSELLRTFSSVDAGSVQDGAASGFVGGLASISLRGFGSQSTLTLINGRRVAPVGAVDINFGRGTLVSVNSIPKGAIERIEILKDGASALYGSDAMAGVINYVLRKDFQGVEASASVGANDKGKGLTHTTGLTFGFGNLDKQRFNVFGGIEYSKRDQVMHSDLKDRGNPGAYDRWRNLNSQFSRFTPDSVASPVFSYYALPPGTGGSTLFDDPALAALTPAQQSAIENVPNNSVFGTNYLGTAPGCAPENTVRAGGTQDPATLWRTLDGPGVSTRPAGLATTGAGAPSLRAGQCRFNLDAADEAIAEQDRLNASLRGTFQISSNLTAYADLGYARTKTTEVGIPRVLTTGVFNNTTALTAVTWPRLNGSFISTPALILPVGHPDNPTSNGQNTAVTAQPVQIIYRFADLPQEDIGTLTSTRLVLGVEGTAFGWDFDTALLHSSQDNERVQTNRLVKSKLEAAVANRTYRFNGSNSAEAARSVSQDAVNEGESTITSLDIRGSRPIFKLPGGEAMVALGFETRREELSSTPDQTYLDGGYVGLVANGASGSRDVQAAYAELSLPVIKALEVQVAGRYERYSDFGNSTTGKLGFKWDAVRDKVAFRGTTATGFRAPSISQVSDSFLVSFHSFQERRIVDPVRCDTSNPANPVSRANPTNNRDCNVLGRTTNTPNPGNLPTVVAGNPNIQPEKSRSYTFGILLQPVDAVDVALDFFYFRRNQEIRVQRGADIMDRYIANPNDPSAAAPVIRDPNPTTWLPGVANSGPILALTRQYGNFEWTKTSGVDWETNIRFPATEYGKFSLKLNGTYSKRFDQKILATSDVQRLIGTDTADLPKSKGTITLKWAGSDWNSFVRYNHIDPLNRSSTDACNTSTSAEATFRRENGWCKIGALKTFDLGVTFNGIKNLSLSANVLNVANQYGRSIDVPHTFTFWDNGTADQLGRRFQFGVDYKFF